MGINSVSKEEPVQHLVWNYPCLLKLTPTDGEGGYILLATGEGRGVVIESERENMPVGANSAAFSFCKPMDGHTWSLYKGEIVLSNS